MPERFRLAHFSDIHVTLPPLSLPRGELRGKRWAGLLSFYAGGRGRRFAGVQDRIRTLLDDVDAQQPDHAVCTGDITQQSYAEEFDACAALFGDRLQHPERFTIIPGNHDRYVPWAVEKRLFEDGFGTACMDGVFPAIKHVSPRVSVVTLDVARPCSFTDSSGMCGDAQRVKLEEILSDASLKDRYVVLAMHYGLLRAGGERDKPTHRIRDDEALIAMLDGEHVHCDLVIHGHMHKPFSVRTRRRLVHCAGSATDLHVACGYNVYDLDIDTRNITVARRAWDRESRRYAAV